MIYYLLCYHSQSWLSFYDVKHSSEHNQGGGERESWKGKT